MTQPLQLEVESQEARERIRRVLYPLHLETNVWPLSGGEIRSLKARYKALQAWYAPEVMKVRTCWDDPYRVSPILTRGEYLWNNVNEVFCHEPEQMRLPVSGWGVDVNLLAMKLASNVDYAQANDNRWLVQDAIEGFPIVNYALGECPYRPGTDAVFGTEDRHLIIRGQHNQLFYTVPELDDMRDVVRVVSYGRMGEIR